MIFRSAQKNIFSPHILTEKSVFGWKSWLKEAGKPAFPALFSLNGGRLLSNSEWHDNRQVQPLAFSRLSGLRTACFSGVQKVSGRRGMPDRRTFVRCARIVSFYRSLVPVRNEAFSWGWNCRFDSLSECDLKNGWEYSGKQIPLFCWWVRGKRISLPLWKWKNWVKKSMLCEKFGDYCLDLSKLIFGGVILAAIMQLDRDIYWIFLR